MHDLIMVLFIEHLDTKGFDLAYLKSCPSDHEIWDEILRLYREFKYKILGIVYG